MISWVSVVFLLLAVFAISTNIAATVFVPDKYPLDLWDILGWLFFIVSILCWEVSKW